MRTIRASIPILCLLLSVCGSWLEVLAAPNEGIRIGPAASLVDESCVELQRGSGVDLSIEILACHEMNLSSSFTCDLQPSYELDFYFIDPYRDNTGAIEFGGVRNPTANFFTLAYATPDAELVDAYGDSQESAQYFAGYASEQLSDRYGMRFNAPGSYGLQLEAFTGDEECPETITLPSDLVLGKLEPLGDIGSFVSLFQARPFNVQTEKADAFIAKLTLSPGIELRSHGLSWPIGVHVLGIPSNNEVVVNVSTAGTGSASGNGHIERSLTSTDSAVFPAYSEYTIRNDSTSPATIWLAGVVDVDRPLIDEIANGNQVTYTQTRRFHAVEYGVVRAQPTTASDIIVYCSPGDELLATGYVHGEYVENSDIWIEVGGGWIHQSGVTERAD